MKGFEKQGLLLLVLGTILISGCVQQGGNEISNKEQANTNEIPSVETTKSPVIEIVKFVTDKKTYSSQEQMKILVVVKSSENVESIKASVWGIMPQRYAYVNYSKIADLSGGENEITFFGVTPYCTSGCGGVYPGPYEIHAEIFVEDILTANSTETINLVGD